MICGIGAIDGPETSRMTVEPCPGDPGMQCLSPEQIARFVLDAAEEDELENMIRHVRHCSRCRYLVKITADAIEESRF